MHALVGNEVKAIGDGVECKQSVYGSIAPRAGAVPLKKARVVDGESSITDIVIKSLLFHDHRTIKQMVRAETPDATDEYVNVLC